MESHDPDPMMDLPDWLRLLDEYAPDGLDVLGPDIAAHYVDGGDTLLVVFALWSMQAQALAGSPLPAPVLAARAQGWSVLSILSRRQDWFLAPEFADYLAAQQAAEFFASFQRVIFYGAGMGGYAACRHAPYAPGAELLVLAPQATLDPAIAGWDNRYRAARRLAFGAQGFAPDHLAQAKAVSVIFDPSQQLDAMHAALFRGSNVQHLRAPGLGARPEAQLQAHDLLSPLFAALGQGRLGQAELARLIRPVRRNAESLQARAAACLQAGQPARALYFAQHAAKYAPAPLAVLGQSRAALSLKLP